MSNVTENTVGFWKYGRRLVSSWLRKGNIPRGCRLMLVENKYKKAGDNKPDYIGYFLDVSDKAAKDIARPYKVLRSSFEEDEEVEDE